MEVRAVRESHFFCMYEKISHVEDYTVLPCGACMNLFLTVAQHWSNKLHYYNSM